MRFGSGALLVAVGLFVLWLATTGRLERVPDAWALLVNGTTGSDPTAPPAAY